MTEFTIWIPDDKPPAQQRHRSRAFTDKSGRTRSMAYKGKAQQKNEDRIRWFLEKSKPSETVKFPVSGAVVLTVKIILRPPASWSKKRLALALGGEERPTGRPDLDNYIKQIQDCANGIIWDDDRQVVEYGSGTGKYYGPEPGWSITVRLL